MDGFKNSTKTQYIQGGDVGTKGAAKVSQTMRAFKCGGTVKKANGGPVAAAPALRSRTDEIMAQQAARRPDMQARMEDRAARVDARDARRDARQAAMMDRRADMQARRPGVPAAPSDRPAIANRQTPVRPGFAAGQAAMKKGGKAVKEYGEGGWATRRGVGSVSVPLDDVKVIDDRAAARADRAKAKAKAEEARYRRALGTDAEILGRAQRSQAQESKELKSLLGYKKGGKVKKMALGGALPTTMPSGNGGPGGTMNPNARRISSGGNSLQDQAAAQAQMAQTVQSIQSMGNPAMKKGGKVKAEMKVAKVMGEFGKGKLHSGSKKGPEVTNPKQAVAIALSEARKAGSGSKKGGLSAMPKAKGGKC